MKGELGDVADPQTNTASRISAFAYDHYAGGHRARVTEYLTRPSGQPAQQPDTIYEYDRSGRLIAESAAESGSLSYAAGYTYDDNGNRLTRTVTASNGTLSTTYEYYPDSDRLWRETQTGPVAAIPTGDNTPVYAYANTGGQLTYQLPGNSRQVGQFGAFWLGLPSIWNTVLFYGLLALIPLALFWPVITLSFPRRRESRHGGSVDSLSTPDLKLWHRMLCVLLAYIFLIGPEAFHTAAQAALQYDQISTLSWGRGSTIIEYGYDANGSLTTKTTTQGATVTETVINEYNLQNRLAKVTTTKDPEGTPQVTVVEYQYDPSGIRVAKQETDSAGRIETSYLIDPANPTGYAQVLEETAERYDASEVLISANRIQYTIGDDVISQTKSAWTAGQWQAAPTQYLLYDGHGSTRQLITQDQTLIDTYSYDGYGVLLQNTSTPLQQNPAAVPEQATSLLYAGEQFDFSIQQSYNRARWYNPWNGRFNRMDDYAGNIHDPQSLHKYLYCHANPINNVDPAGLFSLTEMLMVSVVMGSLAAGLYGMSTALRGGSISEVLEVEVEAFKRWFFISALAYGAVWILSSLWTWMAVGSGGVITAQESAKSGYNSHRELVNAWKSKGYQAGCHIHHFVQQSATNVARFGAKAIHSLNNSVPLAKNLHTELHRYTQSSTTTLGLTNDIGRHYSHLHQYIRTLSWDAQYRWGMALCQYVMQNGNMSGFDPRHYGLL